MYDETETLVEYDLNVEDCRGTYPYEYSFIYEGDIHQNLIEISLVESGLVFSKEKWGNIYSSRLDEVLPYELVYVGDMTFTDIAIEEFPESGIKVEYRDVIRFSSPTTYESDGWSRSRWQIINGPMCDSFMHVHTVGIARIQG